MSFILRTVFDDDTSNCSSKTFVQNILLPKNGRNLTDLPIILCVVFPVLILISLRSINVFISRYAAWNSGYSYNQQGNPAAYSYGASDPTVVPNSVTSSYPHYSQHQSNSQYSYGPSSTVNPNDYYSHYGYSAPHPTSNVYADPNGLFLKFIF